MAGFAIGHGVCARQRKSSHLVHLQKRTPILEAPRGVALGAILAEAALMRIHVAVGAGPTHPGELQGRVAGAT